MQQDKFVKRKQDILSKSDKSSKGNHDKKIIKLCEKINSLENYYTTSSCSGRVVLMIDQDKKEKGLFIKVYHNLITFKQLKDDLDKITRALHSRLKKSVNNKNIKDNNIQRRALTESGSKQLISERERAKLIKFKQEPCILHIACENLKDAQIIYDKAKLVGWKKSGLISFEDRIIVELNSTEKLEFPIIENNKILVNDKFLKIIVEKSNQNLKKSWEKIEKLRKLI